MTTFLRSTLVLILSIALSAVTAGAAGAGHKPGDKFSHESPNVRIVDHPKMSVFPVKGVDDVLFIEARIDLLWDKRTLGDVGCQANGRIEYSRDLNKPKFVPLTEWVSKRETDGNLTLRVLATAFPGGAWYVMRYSVDCPPLPGSGKPGFRRVLQYGIPQIIVAPRLNDFGGFGGGGTWGGDEIDDRKCTGLICPTNPDGSCTAIICFRDL